MGLCFIEGHLAAPKYNKVANFKFALVNCTKAKKIKVLLYFITHRNPHLQ